MEKIWVVTWARAIGGTLADAYAGAEEAYTDFNEALKALTRCKDETLRDLREGFENTEETAAFENSLQVYGGEAEEYYEIDYTLFDETSVEFYMSIQEVTLHRPATK
jgi:hypothetical protein